MQINCTFLCSPHSLSKRKCQNLFFLSENVCFQTCLFSKNFPLPQKKWFFFNFHPSNIFSFLRASLKLPFQRRKTECRKKKTFQISITKSAVHRHLLSEMALAYFSRYYCPGIPQVQSNDVYMCCLPSPLDLILSAIV